MGVWSIASEIKGTKRQREPINRQRFMKQTFAMVNNRLAALVLGGAVVAAGSAYAFTYKSKADSRAPSVKVEVDERPVPRDTTGRTSFAPVVKRVSPGVVRVFATTRAHQASVRGTPD